MMPIQEKGLSDRGQRAWEIYARVRDQVATTENIGKLMIIDVESGDFEIGSEGINSSRRLQERHPGSILYALRIGYPVVEVIGGVLEPSKIP